MHFKLSISGKNGYRVALTTALHTDIVHRPRMLAYAFEPGSATAFIPRSRFITPLNAPVSWDLQS
jgi:hypothetical protein